MNMVNVAFGSITDQQDQPNPWGIASPLGVELSARPHFEERNAQPIDSSRQHLLVGYELDDQVLA